MIIRKAVKNDIDAVEILYDEIHTAEEKNLLQIGWIRGIYPVRDTAESALARGDLFVLEDGEKICGAGIINSIQVDVYRDGDWQHNVPNEDVCVLHTLVISPACSGKGYGTSFLKFYETYALKRGCAELRIDTNEKNAVARAMYKKHGYTEVGIVPTNFNGIPGVNLVLLEKYLG